MQRDISDSIPEIALDWHRQGKGAALATVVETWGSAPRQAGSQLAISGTGEIMGSVSGGCVEGAVVTEALAALEDGRPRLLTFGVSDESAFAVGLACGGTIRILVEPVGDAAPALPVALLEGIVAARAARQAIALAVTLSDWSRRLLSPGDDAAADAALARQAHLEGELARGVVVAAGHHDRVDPPRVLGADDVIAGQRVGSLVGQEQAGARQLPGQQPAQQAGASDANVSGGHARRPFSLRPLRRT